MAPNIILIDAAYADRVAAAFRQHFGAELQRGLPKADLAQWLVCMALDAEFAAVVKSAEDDAELQGVQVFVFHDRKAKVMQNITPSNFSQEIDGKAFVEPGLGEFALACCPVERVTTLEDLCVESLETVLGDKKVERVAVVYDFDGTTAESRTLTQRITKLCKRQSAAEQAKDVTLFTMQPLEGDGFAQQVLGFSLLAALGVSGSEM